MRIVVPFPAGGSFDITARILAQRMGPALGQSAILENRPGAGTVVATECVARLPADGYILLVAGPSFVINPALRSKLPFNPAKDFKAVSQTIAGGHGPMLLVTMAEMSPYIKDTFPIVKGNHEGECREYRTNHVILEIFDALAESIRYQTCLLPTDPRCCHPPREVHAT